MENNISNYVSIELVQEKSSKGNEYRALYLVIRDKNSDIKYRYLLTFLGPTKYDELLSLITK